MSIDGLTPEPLNVYDMLNKKLIQVSTFFLLIFISGCGYNLQDARQPKGISIPSLAIPLMASPSSNLGFEGDFTTMIRQEFVSHSQVPLVSKDQAAVVLIGKVIDIKTEALSYKITDSTFEVTTSRWLKIKLAAKLLDRTTGKVIWNDDKMEEKASFTVSSDPLKTAYNQRRATKMIAKLLAERIYLKTMERF